MQTMTSTEFARNPRAVYDLVLETQETVQITRHGKPVVRVEPVHQKKGITGRELLALIERDERLFGKPPPDPTFLDDARSASPVEAIVDPWAR